MDAPEEKSRKGLASSRTRNTKRAQSWMHFGSFWPRPILPLNYRKPENNGLLIQKNTKEIIIKHKETRMVKDEED